MSVAGLHLFRLKAGKHGQERRHRAAGVELKIGAGMAVVCFTDHFKEPAPGVDIFFETAFFIHHIF